MYQILLEFHGYMFCMFLYFYIKMFYIIFYLIIVIYFLRNIGLFGPP